ncbi:UDP-N-acetylmuramoyl-tripeptide--D-alanyl-D-alanine ligase [Alkaliphilus transvaalensis]|uniref:UDP-N-acetylmuramoyl-tripeptide--D-alanyl-D- alanine ligase n=1 Tax=Alkaliphilus transvaalensis TaxID=114628 RepID=UPI0004789C96|nr:UDP-N-acetylmuramoyl-tripeptide--D-alanyl-D-alanine ligase [Alkaliphilus transvaalensis]
MKQLSIEWIIKACNGRKTHGGKEGWITSISTDSRNLEGGSLFIPLIGEFYDGHQFISQAINNGAVAVLVKENHQIELPENLDDVFIIEVKDTLDGLKELGRNYRKLFSIPFIGVTGSVGKTTTKDLISSSLSSKYNVLKNFGNFNNQIGLPMTLFNLEEEHQVAVLEMGMSSFGEIHNLVDIVRPNISVITNIGMSHIENLGSQKNILKAKMEIATYLTEGDYLLLNGDDEYLKTLKDEKSPYHKVFFGVSKDLDFYPDKVEDLGEKGFTLEISIKGKIEVFKINYPGLHNVYNALAAIWIGLNYNMTPSEIQRGLDSYVPSKMRMEIIELPDIKVINDAYNASPDSMKAALNVLDRLEGNRRIAIFGNMLEMGAFSEEGHRIVGNYVTGTGLDILITVGEMAKWIGEEAKAIGGLKEIYTLENNQEAIEILNKILQKKDLVLVKGSRGMKMEEIIIYLQERS